MKQFLSIFFFLLLTPNGDCACGACELQSVTDEIAQDLSQLDMVTPHNQLVQDCICFVQLFQLFVHVGSVVVSYLYYSTAPNSTFTSGGGAPCTFKYSPIFHLIKCRQIVRCLFSFSSFCSSSSFSFYYSSSSSSSSSSRRESNSELVEYKGNIPLFRL